MTSYLDSTGLHIDALADIVTELENDFRTIYGPNINLAANTPDAQMIRIFAQAKSDMLAIIADVFATMSPDMAVGAVLDQRCALNGIIRRAATYTRTNATVTVDQAVTLLGLDTTDSPFTVADTVGNQFYLLTGVTLAAGAHVLEFRAAEGGAILTTQNNITTVTTVTLGVTAVNNPDVALVTGVNEETDAELRLRRRRSVALPSVGYLAGLEGVLANLDAVENAKCYENITAATDSNGIPGHSIWCIVDGGDDTEIATAIYQKRTAGCGMKGAEVIEVEGLTVKFDRPVYQDLYVEMELTSFDPDHVIDDAYLATEIATRIRYGIYDPADFSAMVALVKELDPLAVVDTGGVSDTGGGPFTSYLYPDTLQHRWTLDSTNINITVV